MNSGPGGFGHAPVTKGLVLTTVASAVVANAARASHRRLPQPLVWLIRSFTFRSPGELLFGCLLLYYFRVFERQQGSRKYGSYAAVVTGMSYAMNLLVNRATQSAATLPPAAFPLLFATFIPFLLDIPPTSHFTVFGYKMSDKAFVYLAGLQLILTSGRQSLPALAASVLSGVLYRLNVFNIRRLRFPRAVTSLLSRLLGPLLIDPRCSGPSIIMVGGAAGRQSGVAGVNEGLQQQDVGGRETAQWTQQQPAQPAAAAAAAPPSPEALQSLLAMGFSRERAVQALQQAGNDLQTAIALLVG